VADWAAFAGLTGVVCALLLTLARLSQTAVRDDPRPLPAGDPPDLDPTSADTNGSGPAVDAAEPHHGPAHQQAAAAAAPSLPDSTPALLANVALTQGVFGAILLGGAVFFRIPASAFGVTADALSTGLPALVLGLGLGAVLYVANELAAETADAAGVEHDEGLRDLLAPDSLAGWAVLMLVVLPIVAGVEEFIFRAAIVGATAAGFSVSPWLLAVVSSVAFALGHGAQGPAGIVVTGSLGLVLAAAFVVSGSLLLVVVAHYVVNALEFLVHEGLGVDPFSRAAG
jgi:membrane protease YdiL (CAAX protease family)